METSLKKIAKQLRDTGKKVQLIYAFNGTGKTRLSKEFRLLVEPKEENEVELEKVGLTNKKVLYYNAFTEDLFNWDNDLENYSESKLKIQPNSFTKWILEVQGQENNIANKFKKYTDSKLTPNFNSDFTEVSFSFERGNNESLSNIKISKGEESNFIWCIFFILLEEFISFLDENDENETEKKLSKYIFIDDPVTSLDDNHLIQLALDLVELIKKSSKLDINFIITTHNPLFYNVLSNELNRDDKVPYSYYKKKFSQYQLERLEDETFVLKDQKTDSPFSYHLFLKSELEKAIRKGEIKKYHFNFLRNILEKTATFLGYNSFVDLLPKTANGQPEPYAKRIINLSSHSKHSGEEISELSNDEKDDIKKIFDYLISNYKFQKEA